MSRTDIELALYHFGVSAEEVEDNAALCDRILHDEAYAAKLSAVVDYDMRAEVQGNLSEGQRLMAKRMAKPAMSALEIGLREAIANTKARAGL